MLYHTDFSLAGVRGRRLHFSIKHGIINQTCKKTRESHGQILRKKQKSVTEFMPNGKLLFANLLERCISN